jgi:hypothetical protein
VVDAASATRRGAQSDGRTLNVFKPRISGKPGRLVLALERPGA